VKKYLTKLTFHIYNYLNSKKITNLSHRCLVCYTQTISRQDEINAYLNKFEIKKDFDELPIIGKKEIIEQCKKINFSKIYSWAYTGGSFGEPLRVPYSKYRNYIRTATFKYFNEKAGYLIGDSFALIRAKNKKTLIKFLRNETIIIPLNISEEKLEEMLQLIKRKNITVLMGYPTVMFELALYMKKKNVKLPIKSLISSSEMLDDEKRNFVKKVFNCDFVDRYSNEEVGLIAQQEIFGEDYYVNKFGVLVEILDLENNPVDSGEIGRVVVSDLNNDLIPLLRYDTGDFAIAGEYKNNQLITIKKVLGRTADVIFNVKNKPVSSLALGPAIYKPLSNASLNIQFQLLQLSEKGYSLKLRSTEKEISNGVRVSIMSELKEILGDDCSINFEYLSDIPPLESGKRPVYLNLFKRNVVKD